tara:strand:- start:512 stop:862 length:351 start_codon:yes stop_codon:yes gene_type:complete
MSIKFILIILYLIFFSFLIKKFLSKLRIKKSFINYLIALKNLTRTYSSENNYFISDNFKNKLDKVSGTGFNLLIRIFLFLIPFILILISFKLINFEITYFSSLFLSAVPYFILLKK